MVKPVLPIFVMTISFSFSFENKTRPLRATFIDSILSEAFRSPITTSLLFIMTFNSYRFVIIIIRRIVIEIVVIIIISESTCFPNKYNKEYTKRFRLIFRHNLNWIITQIKLILTYQRRHCNTVNDCKINFMPLFKYQFQFSHMFWSIQLLYNKLNIYCFALLTIIWIRKKLNIYFYFE